MAALDELTGKTIEQIEILGTMPYPDGIVMTTTDGFQFTLQHDKECCEVVCVKDIVGDLEDLIGSPIVDASVRKSRDTLSRN